MFDYRTYIAAITAIFLALASGILIGITFGEDVVVSNQKDMIEFMQHQLTDLQDHLSCQQGELKRWQGLAPRIINSFKGSLSGKKILILTTGGILAEEMLNLLNEGGAEICLVEVPASPPPGIKFDSETAYIFAARLTGKQRAKDDAGGGYRIKEGEISGRPDHIILYFNPETACPGSGFLGLLGEKLIASGNKIIIAFPENGIGGENGNLNGDGNRDENGDGDGDGIRGGELGENEDLNADADWNRLFSRQPAIAEHLNSFWGKLTLLEILLEDPRSVYSTNHGGGPDWK